MSKLFPEYKKFDLSDINKEVNVFWKENNIFEKSIRIVVDFARYDAFRASGKVKLRIVEKDRP